VRYSGEAKVQPGHGTVTNVQSASSGKRNMDKQIEGMTLSAHMAAMAFAFFQLPRTPSIRHCQHTVLTRLHSAEIQSEADLMPEGAAPGTVPTDIEQATGLERLEILGKMQGIDIFDMKPLPSDRMGTIKEPVMIKSFGEEQYCGCTGIPSDTHHVKWLTVRFARSIFPSFKAMRRKLE